MGLKILKIINPLNTENEIVMLYKNLPKDISKA